MEPDTNLFRIRIGIINSKQMYFFLSFSIYCPKYIENNDTYLSNVHDANENDKPMWTGTAVNVSSKKLSNIYKT